MRQRIPRGFTLIELMIALTVFAVLAAIALPSFRTMILNSRLSSSTNALHNALTIARLNAIQTQHPITVCPFPDDPLSTPLSCGTNWDKGILVIQPAVAPATTDTVIDSERSFTNHSVTLSSTSSSLSFSGRGFLSENVFFNLCDSRGSSNAFNVEALIGGAILESPKPGVVLVGGALSCP